jgi:hypothetical protein
MSRCITILSNCLGTLALVLLVLGLLAVPNQAARGDDDDPGYPGPPITCTGCGGYCNVPGWCDWQQSCQHPGANCTCTGSTNCDKACICRVYQTTSCLCD